MNVKTLKDKLQVGLFSVPALLLFITLVFLPVIGAIYFSVVDWNGIHGSPMTFVGLENYLNVLTDDFFILSLKNLFKLVFFSVLFHTPIALLLTVAIHSKFRGHRIFKAIFFMPTVFPLTAIGLMWYFIFMPSGALNSILATLGLDTIINQWLVNPTTAMPTIIFVNIWAGVGYFMVILLAGLSQIPEEVYEAAEIDGAGPISSFFYLTVPMLKPTIKLCITLDIINTIKAFDLIFVMTEGGPNGLTNVPSTLLYNEAFRYFNFGRASAIGVILLIIAAVATIINNFVTNREG